MSGLIYFAYLICKIGINVELHLGLLRTFGKMNGKAQGWGAVLGPESAGPVQGGWGKRSFGSSSSGTATNFLLGEEPLLSGTAHVQKGTGAIP